MNYKIDVCYIVSHGFSARMIMQTGLLNKLAESGLRVGVITPDVENENLVRICEETGVQLFEYNLANEGWSEDYWNRRKYILEDIKANPALWEKHLTQVKNNLSRNPWKRVRPYLNIGFYHLSQAFPKFRNWYKRNELSFIRSSKAKAFLENIAPKLVISTYPVNLQESVLLLAAKENPAVKTAIHLLSWDNITCKGHFPVLADKYLAWGPIMKSEYQSFYDIAASDVFECGVPHFDLHVASRKDPQPDKFLEKLGLDPQKPYVFVALSSPYYAPKEIEIVEWLADKINEKAFGPDLQMIVRPHPQNVEGKRGNVHWLPRIKALKSDRVSVDMPQMLKNTKLKWSMQKDDMHRLSHLLAGCSICINSGSTISIETLMVGKPVILTSFDADENLPYWKSSRRLIDYTHLKKFLSFGGIKATTSYAEFEAEINNYLKDPNYNLEARNKTLFQECGTPDGKATQRAVEAIISIV